MRTCTSRYGDGNSELYIVKGEQAMLAEVSANGPIVVHIRTNDAFFAYAGGIFMGGSGNTGDHALALIGWGTDGGTKYWLVSNSWGARPPAPHPWLLEQLQRMHAHTTRPCSVPSVVWLSVQGRRGARAGSAVSSVGAT